MGKLQSSLGICGNWHSILFSLEFEGEIIHLLEWSHFEIRNQPLPHTMVERSLINLEAPSF